jgi:hypothetical protein
MAREAHGIMMKMKIIAMIVNAQEYDCEDYDCQCTLDHMIVNDCQ